MASDLSKFLGNKICMWLAGTQMPTPPSALYLAVFNGDPKASGTEVTTQITADGRPAIPLDDIVAGEDNVLASDADVDLGDSENAVPSMTHVAVFDAAVGGNRLASKAIPGGAVAIEVGTGVKFLSGDLTFTIGA